MSGLSPTDRTYCLILAVQRPLLKLGISLGLCEADPRQVTLVARDSDDLDLAWNLLKSRTATLPWLVATRHDDGISIGCDERSWFALDAWPKCDIRVATEFDGQPTFLPLGPYFVLCTRPVELEPPDMLVEWQDSMDETDSSHTVKLVARDMSMHSSGSIDPDDSCLDETVDSIEEAVREATSLCQRFRHCSISMRTTLDPACLGVCRERYADPSHLVA